jgi:hypothetical protein
VNIDEKIIPVGGEFMSEGSEQSHNHERSMPLSRE